MRWISSDILPPYDWSKSHLQRKYEEGVNPDKCGPSSGRDKKGNSRLSKCKEGYECKLYDYHCKGVCGKYIIMVGNYSIVNKTRDMCNDKDVINSNSGDDDDDDNDMTKEMW